MMNTHSKPSGQEHTRRRITELGPWFHNITIDGIATAPDHFLGDYPAVKWQRFADALPDVAGRTVLDIGCNAGFYAIEMKRRGAARVLGIDSDPHYLNQAAFAAEAAGVDLELRQMSVYDLGRIEERFDLVIFMGVFYHLRHPLLALDLIREHVADDLLLFQSLMRGSNARPALAPDHPFEEVEIFDDPDFPCLYFVEQSYAHDPTNWFIPNRAGIEAMLRSAGFSILKQPEREVYLCNLGPRDAAGVPPFCRAAALADSE